MLRRGHSLRSRQWLLRKVVGLGGSLFDVVKGEGHACLGRHCSHMVYFQCCAAMSHGQSALDIVSGLQW